MPEGRDQPFVDAAVSSGRLHKALQEGLENATCRLTAHDLEGLVARQNGWPRRRVRQAIRDLIVQGVLEYIYIFGQTYLELSFHHPVDVSPRFTIVPPTTTIASDQTDRHYLTIAPGASFGCGRHATTRLALHALETAWDCLQGFQWKTPPAVIDIGTGSGILAIAAACLGAAPVVALDIDTCARSEARQNIHMNAKAAAITVSGQSLESVHREFNMVMANLRLPTLVSYAGWMRVHLRPPGCAVVSGFRKEEWMRLQKVFEQQGFDTLGYLDRQGWAAAAFSCLT